MTQKTETDPWHAHRVACTEDETDEIRSFYLVRTDGSPLPCFQPGQFLTLRLPIGTDPAESQEIRTYTVSSAPADPHYRISVKREGPAGPGLPPGRASNWLHDRLTVGDTLPIKPPSGDFTLDATEHRPALLLSGGVGITPMMAMLRHVVQVGIRTGRTRPLVFVHSARTRTARPFRSELAQLEDQAPADALRLYSVVTDEPHPAPGQTDADVDKLGRIDRRFLDQVRPADDPDVYLCGPPGFMQALYDTLRELGTLDARIRAEAFGPGSLTRQPDAGQDADPSGNERTAGSPIRHGAAPAEQALITFAQSGFARTWTPADGTLLEFAEHQGLSPDFGCRAGQCGTCATRIPSGTVTYCHETEATPPDGHALICSAVPAVASNADERDPAPPRVTLDL